ncbi:MAG: DUF4440 domain-containing protein [Pirellulales bacterium]
MGSELELLAVNQQLLESIVNQDWATYAELCDASLTCFEPETRGQVVEGLPFHQYYFDLPAGKNRRNVTMSGVHVRLLGPEAAVLSYVRLTQFLDAAGVPQTSRVEETRVWQKIDGRWKHVHFHRSSMS